MLTHAMGGGGYAVSTFDLLEAVGDTLDRLADRDNEEKSNSGGGGLYALAELMSNQLGVTADAVYRRINDVRNLKTRSLNAQMAEVLVDEVRGAFLHQLDIPTLPRGVKPAREMVEAWTDLTELEAERLARSLAHFAAGYVSTFEDAARAVAKKEQAAAAKKDEEAELITA